MEIQKVIDELKNGNKRFVEKNLRPRTVEPNQLKDGQSPHTVILTCSDSRVAPELLFDMDLGEVFIIRLAGNIATSEGVASIEYAVANLGSSVLMVLGHSGCGAVTAAVSASEGAELPSNNLKKLVEPIKRAVEKSGGDIEMAISENIHITCNDLIEQSSIIKDLVDANKLQILGAKYKLESGIVEFI
jgi:carbonic anhydrase